MLTIDSMIDAVSEVSAIEHDVARINSIADLYKPQRQDSKMPTFLLTYGGTHIGMMAQGNFTLEKALQIDARYHELYRVSDEWVAARLEEASKVGYVTVAFGLRLRTPLLHQVVRGTRATPYEAEAEGRTAGNALGQSWCLLNSRALTEFMRTVRKGEHRLKIRPISQIHDASYFLIPDDIEVLRYVNEHLVKAVEWQDHPAIAHDTVKLGGELGVFYPSWSHEAVIPNGATEEQVLDAIQAHVVKLDAKGIPH
jgi:DNA polymerase I